MATNQDLEALQRLCRRRPCAGRPLQEVKNSSPCQGSGSGIGLVAAHSRGTLGSDEEKLNLCHRSILAIWSGQSAKTGPRVKRLSWPNRHGFVHASAELVMILPVTPSGDPRFFFFRRRSAASGYTLLNPKSDPDQSAAESCGGAAKPSGAGGGDCAVAFFPAEQVQCSKCVPRRRSSADFRATLKRGSPHNGA